MNIETVITVTHFSVSVKQLIGFLRACIDFPRTCFWAAGTSSPRLLPNFSSIWLPANLVLGSQHLFSALAAQLLEYLASRELTFGQSVPLHHACCPTSRVFSFPCTSQQKVDTFFIFYTLKTEHSTPYIVLVSNSLMSMQVFLH